MNRTKLEMSKRRIAFFGEIQSYTHLAAQAKFGKECTYVPTSSIDEVFNLVERDEVELGVIPIENSIGGSVTAALDRFVDFKKSPVKIQGEIQHRIEHHLLMRKRTRLGNIKVVSGHPQALAQCEAFLRKHIPAAFRLEAPSTGHAVHFLIFKLRETFGARWKLSERAAIGPKKLGMEHKLKTYRIPQKKENTTRFLIIGHGEPRRGRHNRTSILFGLRHKPGALYDALQAFKRYKVNLTKIQSRPDKHRAWEYLFFVDLEGHTSERKIKKALALVKRHTVDFQLLGSYSVAR